MTARSECFEVSSHEEGREETGTPGGGRTGK